MTQSKFKLNIKTCDNVIKYITVHNAYLMLNKLCFWGDKRLSGKGPQVSVHCSTGLLHFTSCLRQKTRHKEGMETLGVTIKEYYLSVHYRAHSHGNSEGCRR